MQATGKRPGYPTSAFCLFSKERRALLKRQNPSVPQSALVKRIKREWKLSKDKDRYKRQASLDY